MINIINSGGMSGDFRSKMFSQDTRVIYKDIDANTIKSLSVTKLPSGNKANVYPSKGDIMYNIPSETMGQNGVLWYGDGTSWLSLLSNANLNAGTSISIADTGGVFTINNVLNAGVSINLSISGPGAGTYTITNVLNAGNGIGLSISGPGAGEYTITNTSPATSVTLSSAGGQTLVNQGAGPNLVIAGITGGTGISLTPTGLPPTSVAINSTTTLSSLDPSSSGSLVPGSPQSAPSLSVKSLLAGSGIALTPSSSDVTITQTMANLTFNNNLYTSSGSAIIPTNALYPTISACGGGGGGGGGDASSEGGGGGGGGTLLSFYPVPVGATISWTIGTGGNGGPGEGLAGPSFVPGDPGNPTIITINGGQPLTIFGGNPGIGPQLFTGVGGVGSPFTQSYGFMQFFGTPGGDGGGSKNDPVAGIGSGQYAGGSPGADVSVNFGGGGGGATPLAAGANGGTSTLSGGTGNNGSLGSGGGGGSGQPAIPGGDGGNGGDGWVMIQYYT